MPLYTVDFETEAIVGNPTIDPPEPVGVAIKHEDHPGQYFPMNEDTAHILRALWDDPDAELLFHNAPFDLCVAEKHLGLKMPPWERVHDTMFLLYLRDPYSHSLSLKPSAERYLNVPPDEQDRLKEWILTHVREAKEKDWGAYIARAPFEIVEPYAIGDVDRTKALYDHLLPDINLEPYNRERELMPILIRATQKGIRVDRERLLKDYPIWCGWLDWVTHLIRVRLESPSLNPGSGPQLAAALDRLDLVTEWKLTPTGRKSTKKEYLLDSIKDPNLLAMLLYRSTLDTCLGTFYLSWIDKSEQDGRVHPNWNAIRSTEGRRKGTRTGRLSSDNPNFQNVPTEFSFEIPEGLPPLPQMRDYVLPEEGHVWLKRDFSSQEIRILAHFEDGTLMEAYIDDPGMDPHALAQELMLQATYVEYPRKAVKITAFLIVYGGGIPALSQQLHRPPDEAAKLRSAYYNAFPGVKTLGNDTKRRGDSGQPIQTWGGRLYYAEPSKIINGYYRDFGYKLLNYLIQGSAADQTKQCLIDWHNARPEEDIFMATVHDEINISVPIERKEEGMRVLREAMDQKLFDVPMRSEGFCGTTWHQLEGMD